MLPAPAKTTPIKTNMADEQTYIMIKPDGVHRQLVGEIVKRFEQKGFKLVALKLKQVMRHATSYVTRVDVSSHCSPPRSCWSSTTATWLAARSSTAWWRTCSRAPSSAWCVACVNCLLMVLCSRCSFCVGYLCSSESLMTLHPFICFEHRHVQHHLIHSYTYP